MDLGQKIKQARLESGLSQRQVCGDKLTRNMLSLIENGNARPSMDTLGYLAERLGRPISWFLEERAASSANFEIILQARNSEPRQVLELLDRYQSPDEYFDRERYLLEAVSCLSLAGIALEQGQAQTAAALLEQAAQAGARTPYYTEDMERKRLLLCADAGQPALPLVEKLPDLSCELMLRAKAALEMCAPEKALSLLDAAETRDPQWFRLRGDTLFVLGRHKEAVEAYEQAVSVDPPEIYRCLEQCSIALGDYKNAYLYACMLRR